MSLGDFTQEIAFWCQEDGLPPIECWVDGLNLSLSRVGAGVRCHIEFLDSVKSADFSCVAAVLLQGAASLANECRGALCRDPEDESLKLVVWLPEPVTCEALLLAMGDLVNQRAAWLSLVKPAAPPARTSAVGRTVLSRWQEGVLRA